MNFITRKMLGAALVASVVLASAAGAVTLRTPQVSFANGSLQGLLNAWDGGINTATDQLDGQIFATSYSGNTDFTLLIKLGGYSNSNVIGVYNGADASPTLYPLFPSYAVADYSVACKFRANGNLIVDLSDQNGQYLGSTTYTGVTRNFFGFYIAGPGGTFYSQDYRNGNQPQMLTYAGTNTGTNYNFGDWFECFNDTQYTPTATFDSAVLMLQSVAPLPTPTNNRSWGSLKSTYR